MQFICDQKHKFHYPAKQTSINGTNYETCEVSTCPFCHSLTFTEYVEPEADIEAVYIHDLTSGDQVILSTLLAEGWKIVTRYAKQYHLEKPKAVESPQETEKAEAPLP